MISDFLGIEPSVAMPYIPMAEVQGLYGIFR